MCYSEAQTASPPFIGTFTIIRDRPYWGNDNDNHASIFYSSMHRFFIDPQNSASSDPYITGTDVNHIINTLRLTSGSQVGLFDGTGIEFIAEITTVSKKRIGLKILDRKASTAESPVSITVGQAFLKERKMDGLVRQLTELGITRWIPVFTERSIPRPSPDRLANRIERWQKIALEAVKQCRRARIPEIGQPLQYDAALANARNYPQKIIFWEDETAPTLNCEMITEDTAQTIFVLIGPEGGFTANEVAKARTAGFDTAGLGPRILRAETATVAACAIVQHRYGDVMQKKA